MKNRNTSKNSYFLKDYSNSRDMKKLSFKKRKVGDT